MKPRLTDFEVGWAAGMLDGEGHINLIRQTRAAGFSYALQVDVTNTDHRALAELKRLFGGTIKERAARENRRAVWRWYLTASAARDLLILLEPHLRIKREEAQVAILCPGNRKRPTRGWLARFTPQEREEQALAAATLKALRRPKIVQFPNSAVGSGG